MILTFQNEGTERKEEKKIVEDKTPSIYRITSAFPPPHAFNHDDVLSFFLCSASFVCREQTKQHITASARMKEFKRILDFISILKSFFFSLFLFRIFFFAFFRKELDEFPTDEGNTHKIIR
jgi:hypothetical protein